MRPVPNIDICLISLILSNKENKPMFHWQKIPIDSKTFKANKHTEKYLL